MPLTTWSYDPSASARDLRLDLLRGLCLVKMIFNHLWHTPLHVVQEWLGYVTAAEGFFFLSGTVVGIVHGKRMHTLGLGVTSRRVLTRALDLYLANLAFVFLFLALEASEALPFGSFSALWIEDFPWGEAFHFNQPYFLHVLPRYVAFLALTPLALWCLKTRHTPWLVTASGALWGWNLLAGQDLLVPWFEPTAMAGFPLVSWQLLFMIGIVIGYHRQHLGRFWRQVPTWAWGLLLGLSSLAFILFRVGYEHALLHVSGSWIYLLFGRDHLGPVRLVNLTVFFAFCFLLTDRLWKPVHRWSGPLLVAFGQRSLYVFLLHIPIVWLGFAWLPSLSPLAPDAWSLVLVDAAAIALLWGMVRTRALFALIPN